MSAYFEIKKKIVDDIQILQIIGELDALVAPSFKEEISAAFKNNFINIIIDFKELSHINSLGIGILVSKLREIKTKNGTIKLVNLTKHTSTIFEVIGLNEIFEIFTSESEALKSFKKNNNKKDEI